MAQWCERLPPTNVSRVRFSSYVAVSLLLVLVLAPRVFLRFSGFPPFSKINTSKLQFNREFEGHGFISLRLLFVTLVKQGRL